MDAQDEWEEKQEHASLPVGTTALIAELLASMSHELRTPLATIKAYTATLLRGERRISRAEQHAFLLAIERAGDHLEVVIDHLLEMASLETGTLTLELSVMNLVQLLREAVSAAERRMEAEQVLAAHRLRFQFKDPVSAPGEGVFVEADRHRLGKVLDHLLENAITYSPEGGTIEVSLRTRSVSDRIEPSQLLPQSGDGLGNQTVPSHQLELPEQWEWVEISVRDEGQGIAAEHLARVFDPFYRVDMRLVREVNGLGLGLAICKRIVELHGGEIRVESTPGAGSTFHVRLPGGGPRAASARFERRGLHAREEDHDPGGR
jgi:signal transduction histidine kinase